MRRAALGAVRAAASRSGGPQISGCRRACPAGCARHSVHGQQRRRIVRPGRLRGSQLWARTGTGARSHVNSLVASPASGWDVQPALRSGCRRIAESARPLRCGPWLAPLRVAKGSFRKGELYG